MDRKQQTEALKYFKEYAQDWKRKANITSQDKVNVIKQRNDYVIKVVNERNNTDLVLDVGCGTGDLVCELVKKGIGGIGVDVENISRFRELDFNKNKTFYKKIFNENEIKYCLSKREPYQHFAARFCAKEAFIKAMGKSNKDYKDIEIKVKNNKPFILWNGKKYLLSLSHDKDKAIAFVVIENEK